LNFLNEINVGHPLWVPDFLLAETFARRGCRGHNGRPYLNTFPSSQAIMRNMICLLFFSSIMVWPLP